MTCPKCKNTEMEEKIIKAPERTPFGLLEMPCKAYMCSKCRIIVKRNSNKNWFVKMFENADRT